jgi:hypothetical protein
MHFLVWYLLLRPMTAETATIRFDGTTLGKLPANWTVAMTHAGAAPRWEIVRDETAPQPPYVLAQLSQDKTAGRFPLAIWKGATLEDGSASVAFKAVEGTVDRAAGIRTRTIITSSAPMISKIMLCSTRWRTVFVPPSHRKVCRPAPMASNTPSRADAGIAFR